jgi:transglutaminase-like putative cysteine protease
MGKDRIPKSELTKLVCKVANVSRLCPLRFCGSLLVMVPASTQPATARNSAAFPRMLMGVTLIFWGWMIDQPLVGLILAFLMEGPHWIPIRWNFGEKAYVRAWSISVAMMLLTAIILALGKIEPETVRIFVSWMPVFLAPLQFTQVYGFADRMPLSTFSYFSRKKIALDQSLGMTVHPILIPFTPLYFTLTLLFTAAGRNAYHVMFFPGVLVLCIWCMWALIGKGIRRKSALAISLFLTVALAAIGQWGLIMAHEWLNGGISDQAAEYGGNSTRWHRSNTNIGQVGKIKQSSEIFWRIRTEQTPSPTLLMTAAYNKYVPSGQWSYDTPDQLTQEEDFLGVAAVGKLDRGNAEAEDEKLYYTPDKNGIVQVGQEARNDLPRFSIRGATETDALLPLPGSLYTMYANVQVLEVNSVGSIRITPRHAVIDTIVRWDGPFDREQAPFPPQEDDDHSPDVFVPPQEKAVIREIVDSLKLREMPIEQKIATIRSYFSENFTYSTYLRINTQLNRKWRKEQQNKRYRSMTGRDSFLAQFLLEEKSGHCEYFATATTLLLRQAGVPARYCVGFSVQEMDLKTGELVLRGTHAHAWCRAWDEKNKRWIDVDTTPPSWINIEQWNNNWQQKFADALQRWREDFTVWRTQPENQAMAATVFYTIGGAVLAWVAWRLWKTRTRIRKQSSQKRKIAHVKTPLSDLEKWIAQKIGPRPLGMPFGTWVAQLKNHGDPTLIEEAVQIHHQLRFDPQSSGGDLREKLLDLCRDLKKT